MKREIKCVHDGVYFVDPENVPLCYVCDQPMFKGEDIDLQYIDAGPGNQDLVAIVHSECADEEYNDEDDE